VRTIGSSDAPSAAGSLPRLLSLHRIYIVTADPTKGAAGGGAEWWLGLF